MIFKTNASAKKSARAVFEPFEDRTLFSTYTVTTTTDSGTGSLRAAITSTNAHAGADTIQFIIGSGQKTITPTTQLPQLTDTVTIDATTQPGYAGKPLIELNGSKAGGYGLAVRGGNSTVKGLDIDKWSTGILILGGNGNTIKGNYIGTNLSGNAAAGNTDKGMIVQSANNTIGGSSASDRNVISGNKNNGIQLYTTAATGNKVSANYIGTNAAGTAAIANGSGVAITGGTNNTIGGTSSSQRNILSGNSADGAVVNSSSATGNVIEGNYVGVDFTGEARLANGNYGVEISSAHNTVGGTTAGQRNVISGNDYSGVALWLSSGSYNTVEGNYIGTDAAGSKAIGNVWRGIDVTNGSSNNLIGGTANGAGNVISGNVQSGVEQYQGSSNRYVGNTIGFSANHTAALGNGHDGIQFVFASNSSATGNYIGNNAASALARIGGSNITQSGNTIINDTLYGF